MKLAGDRGAGRFAMHQGDRGAGRFASLASVGPGRLRAIPDDRGIPVNAHDASAG